MSDKRGYFPHYQIGGAWGKWIEKKITTRTVSERLNPTKRDPRGFTGPIQLGTNVRFFGNETGQVWALAAPPYRNGRGTFYWIARPDGSTIRLQEVDLTVIGHCHDEPLFETA